MEEVEAQKIIENLESIAAEKGANALTGEVIEECCRANGVDPEDFRNFICENIDLQEIKKLQGLEELSFEELDQVAGGAQSVKQGIASFLAATSLLSPATNFTASAVRPTTATRNNVQINPSGFWSKKKILPAMKIGFTAVGASLFVWAFSSLGKIAVQAKQLSQLQVTANNLHDNKAAMLGFARRISTDIQEIYDALIDEQPQIDTYSDSFVGKIVDSMQEKLKHSSYLSNTDCSVEIPDVSGQIKVNTLLSDYVYARLYGKRRGSYDLAVCFMTHCLASLWKLKGVLLKFPTPHDTDYTVYKQILENVTNELNLGNGNIKTLKKVHASKKALEKDVKEARQKKDIDTLKGFQQCFTPDSAVWLRYANCITEITQGKNPTSEIKNLTDGMSNDLRVSKAIRTLQAGFSEPKTIFEKYLFDMSNYYEGWLNSGTLLASLTDTSFSLFVLALEHLGTLATSSKYAESPMTAKQTLEDLTLCLSNLRIPLSRQDRLCCARDGYDPDDLLEMSLVFSNILTNIKASCFSDKYKKPTTDRELLQIIFNDKRTNRELERFTERASLQTRNETEATTENEKQAALIYQSNCSTNLNAFLQVSATEAPGSGNIKYSLDNINYLHSVVTNLINLIRRTPTEREITVYRGVNVSRNYVRAYLTNMAGRLILADQPHPCSSVNLSLDLTGITTQLKDDTAEMIYKDLSFMSTSVSKHAAIEFSGASGNTQILQKITVPTGTPCYAYPNTTSRSYEEELLFLPGTKLKLKEIKMIGGKTSPIHQDYTLNPTLVTLCFDMIPPNADELAKAARQRKAWVDQCPAMSANQANIENPKE